MILGELSTYLHFLWHSKNAHGVHSPFVYEWLSNGMKPQTNEPKGSKSMRLAYRNIQYFQPQNLALVGSETFKSTIKAALRGKANQEISTLPYFDMIIAEEADENLIEFVLPKMHEKSVLLIQKLSKTQRTKLTKDERICVSIDCFHWLILVKKPTQAKQHFVLRVK